MGKRAKIYVEGFSPFPGKFKINFVLLNEKLKKG